MNELTKEAILKDWYDAANESEGAEHADFLVRFADRIIAADRAKREPIELGWPAPDTKDSGWEICPKYLFRLEQACLGNGREWVPCMEEIETVLLALKVALPVQQAPATTVAQRKIKLLLAEGYEHYAATVLRRADVYALVGSGGDVRWSYSEQARVPDEPPCGWKEYHSLFITAAAHVGRATDSEAALTESERIALYTVIQYGKRAIEAILKGAAPTPEAKP